MDAQGHGIGATFHMLPYLIPYRNSFDQGDMMPGHVFTIEPALCQGTGEHQVWPDEWTAVTKDGGLSAQFEHTLLITNNGVEILT
jgi:methionyl aminopeptidase